ncbi:hypothetical protein [Natrinema salinisoli]|uniref:hypothetical protein n=1 Tax=Natrinema salinisoli TaxID=2878535 RepID=UPI001CF02BDA|nr:hypothetical protein [Natrinema salinisoli]
MTADSADRREYDVRTGDTFCSMVLRENERDDGSVSYRVTFPEALEYARIIRRKNTVNWFCDLEQKRVMVADPQKPWEDTDRFHWVNASKVDGGKVTTIPKPLFTGGIFNVDSPGDFLYAELAELDERDFCLRADHLYLAVSPWDCLAGDAAFLVAIEDYIDMFDEAAQAGGMAGGRELAENFVDEDDLLEDHSLSIEKCLENAETAPNYWPDSATAEDDSDNADEAMGVD